MKIDQEKPWSRYARLLEGPADFDQYDCDLNVIPVEDLFARYHKLGFLYPAKLNELESIWDKVKENWELAYRLKTDVLRVYTYKGPKGEFATTTLWRSGYRGWTAEHLAADDPVAAMIMILGVLTDTMKDDVQYVESWYRPTNPYPNRLYSRALRDIGSDLADIRVHNYLAVYPSKLQSHIDNRLIVEEVREGSPELLDLAVESRGHVYALGEDFSEKDIQLDRLHNIYQKVGLSRQRKVYLLYRLLGDVPLGAAVVYRGPLGFNFSLIENRCDLLLSDRLSAEDSIGAIAALIEAVRPNYDQFPPGYIPVVGDAGIEDAILTASAGRLIRRYAHFGVLRDGLPKWYDSVVDIIGRVVRHRAAKEAR